MWIDLEMTDIADVEHGRIMEVGVIFTGPTMEMLDVDDSVSAPVAYHRVISLTEDEIGQSSEWSKQNHSTPRRNSSMSLFDLCRSSTFTIRDVDAEVAGLIRSHAKGRPMIIAGSSISCDRIFIQKHMPETANLLHHRMIDVSTILELTRRMYPGIRFSHFSEHSQHSAMSDIFSSLHLMHSLQSTVFMPMISTPSASSAPPASSSSSPPPPPPSPVHYAPPQPQPQPQPQAQPQHQHQHHHHPSPFGQLMMYSPPSQASGQHPHLSHAPSQHLIVRQSISLTPHLMEMCIAGYRTDIPTALYCHPYPLRLLR